MDIPQPNPNDAGTYIVEKDGTRRLVEPVTADHPEGNAPRPADEAAMPVAPRKGAVARLVDAVKGGEQ